MLNSNGILTNDRYNFYSIQYVYFRWTLAFIDKPHFHHIYDLHCLRHTVFYPC